MWKYMESTRPSVFVKNYEEGITTVKRGGYAFLMESTVLDYVVQVSIQYNTHWDKNPYFVQKVIYQSLNF